MLDKVVLTAFALVWQDPAIYLYCEYRSSTPLNLTLRITPHDISEREYDGLWTTVCRNVDVFSNRCERSDEAFSFSVINPESGQSWTYRIDRRTMALSGEYLDVSSLEAYRQDIVGSCRVGVSPDD